MTLIDHKSGCGRNHPGIRRRHGRMLSALAVVAGGFGASLAAQAAVYSVGPGGDGCTHTTLAAAVASAASAAVSLDAVLSAVLSAVPGSAALRSMLEASVSGPVSPAGMSAVPPCREA